MARGAVAEGLIRPFEAEYEDYVRDESRSRGHAESISFPTSEEEVREALRALAPEAVPVTVQGARTGLAAGAVPAGGHVMNLSRMNRYLGLRQDEEGRFYLRVQPGVVLLDLRRHLAARDIPAAGWDDASLRALEALSAAPLQMFPTDPTETSACLGGMAACNASGARSFRYGPMRGHVSALRLVLADGDVLALRRGEARARGRALALTTEGGRALAIDLPTYEMPACKNASGYYAADDMDALDLIIGSDGTLGIITEIELALMPAPAITWAVSCFLADERQVLDATCLLRRSLAHASALEYFDEAALRILRAQRAAGAAFASLVEPPAGARACLYVELACDTEDEAMEDLARVGAALEEVGASERSTWVARTDVDREALTFFRHAVPESVNMLIDERRRIDPSVTKLGSDMAVPDERLHDVVALYRTTLAEAGLEAAAWGHIGNNHLHVNVLPRDASDYAAGKRLFARWAREVAAMGGAVSAEHGVGKLKRDFLREMYGRRALVEMARVKQVFDPQGQLGRGNLFDEALLAGVPAVPGARAGAAAGEGGA
ncbi:FAD-binding oxidoreductase [Collinsella sp. An268]|uniref:FAD-binding oxidoreductase n=1 Tax=Collinsella sp. An268 TaxID=1965612 RepID=UPI000B36F627|nr:FAD-binding oxidoreductase [Collinsella sp. An268]OUO64532.1 FAD-binding oxidoreductase [Collinsella sp. An268]